MPRVAVPVVTWPSISLTAIALPPVAATTTWPSALIEAVALVIPLIAVTRAPMLAIPPRLMSRFSTTTPALSSTATRKVPLIAGASAAATLRLPVSWLGGGKAVPSLCAALIWSRRTSVRRSNSACRSTRVSSRIVIRP